MRDSKKLLPLLFLVGLVSLGVRAINNLRIAETERVGGRSNWITIDPDSHYHMRRLDRALEAGGYVDPQDPLIDWPSRDAAPIPWPGMYTRFLYVTALPFAPEPDDARRAFVERHVARMPMVLAALTSMMVAFAGWRLTGGSARAALVAGLGHAFCFASMRYSFLGMGDHHAWTSLLHVTWLTLASEGCSRLDHKRSSRLFGAAAGWVAGLSLASWVATLIALAVFQLTVLALLFAKRKELPAGLVPFSAFFHGAALLTILPDVWRSPWPAMDLINLSEMHAAGLFFGLIGSLLVGRFAAKSGKLIGGFALALVVSAALLQAELATSWAWLSGSDSFMAHIRESQALKPAEWASWLGYGAIVVPIAWLACLRGATLAHWPWLFAAPVVVAMSLLQQRFTEGAAAIVFLLLGLASARLPKAAWLTVVLALVSVFQHPRVTRTTWNRTIHGVWWYDSARSEEERQLRAAARYLRASDQPGAVLAQWDLGHLIEWAGESPTLATNFGGYLSDRWLDPWRFFAAQSLEEGLPILKERDVSHILITADWRRNRIPMSQFGPVESSLAARLAGGGGVPGLRLAYEGRGVWIYEAPRD